jgi:glycosyltransferase involved in cell wall biosynthesis
MHLANTNELPHRIAILLPNLAGGGAEWVNLLLAREFLNRGFAVDFVLAQRRGELLSEVPEKCRVFDLGAKRLRNVPWQLRHYMMTEEPGALLAAMWPLTALAGLTLRISRSPVRLVVSGHTDLRHAPEVKAAERLLLKVAGPWLYGRAAKVIAVSNGVRESLHELARLPSSRTQVIYNPVRQSEADEFEEQDEELIRWWQAGDLKLIAVGSLKPAKDYPTLLQAVERLRQSIDARLLVLGEGPKRKALTRIAERGGLGQAVRFAGFRASPQPYLRMADVFVLSSRWEGLGNVITEALLCGCRVVSTNCPSGPAELLAGGRYGRLVPPGDSTELARAISESAAAPHDPEPGITWAKQFNAKAAAEAYLNLLFPDEGTT